MNKEKRQLLFQGIFIVLMIILLIILWQYGADIAQNPCQVCMREEGVECIKLNFP